MSIGNIGKKYCKEKNIKSPEEKENESKAKRGWAEIWKRIQYLSYSDTEIADIKRKHYAFYNIKI